MRARIFQLLGAIVLAEALATALFLPSCGVLASGRCADKATCAEPDVGAPANPPDGTIDPTDIQAGDSGDVESDVSSDTGADAVSERPGIDVVTELADAAHDAGSIDGSHDASKDATDAASEDATVDAGVDASFDAFEDVPADAIFMGDTAACGPCTNSCVASFVQCCTDDGGCGCIELFFPVVCY